jgi:hypothetical protein
MGPRRQRPVQRQPVSPRVRLSRSAKTPTITCHELAVGRSGLSSFTHAICPANLDSREPAWEVPYGTQ